MNKTLMDLLNRAKAVKTTNDALIESFERYIHQLMQQELDYEYIKIDEFKKNLKYNSWRMALYESRLNSLTDEENFNHFCRYIHLQMEGLINYYLKIKFPSCHAFKKSYSLKIEERLNTICEFKYSEFKMEHEDYKVKLDKKEISEEESLLIQKDFKNKYEKALLNFLKGRFELKPKAFIDIEKEVKIIKNLDYSIIHTGAKNIEDKYTEISRIPFAYKFEYFSMIFDYDNNYKLTVEALTDYRNKELSHGGELNTILTKGAVALKERKNFMSLKDSLQEMNQIIKINT